MNQLWPFISFRFSVRVIREKFHLPRNIIVFILDLPSSEISSTTEDVVFIYSLILLSVTYGLFGSGRIDLTDWPFLYFILYLYTVLYLVPTSPHVCFCCCTDTQWNATVFDTTNNEEKKLPNEFIDRKKTSIAAVKRPFDLDVCTHCAPATIIDVHYAHVSRFVFKLMEQLSFFRVHRRQY